MGEIATHTHLMAPHFRPRRAEPQPNRTQSVKHSFQDCRNVGHATTTQNMSMSSFPVLSVCRVPLPLVHFVSSPTRSRAVLVQCVVAASRKYVKEMCKMTAQFCLERPMKNEEYMRVLQDFTGFYNDPSMSVPPVTEPHGLTQSIFLPMAQT